MDNNYIKFVVRNLDQAEGYVKELLKHIEAIRAIEMEMNSNKYGLNVEMEFASDKDKTAANR